MLKQVYNDRTNKGLLVHHGLAKEEQHRLTGCRQQADRFFGDLFEWRTQHAPANGRVGEPGGIVA